MLLRYKWALAAGITLATAGLMLAPPMRAQAATQSTSDSVGLEATVPGGAPSTAASIDIPRNGQTFSNLPITVSGFCPSGTLVEIYKNNVFSGSTQCSGGSFSLQIDLFDGRNDLVARVYDSLNQAGPDSSAVTVYFSNGIAANSGPRLSITTQYAKRGADPGSILTWPITISGGTGPFAISVDWGDKSTPDLISQQIPGDVTLQHTYAKAGIYNVVVKASDANANAAFLQLVGVGNGKIQQSTAAGQANNTSQKTNTKILWLPMIVLFVLALLAFWLGQKHQLEAIRQRLRRGEQPFS